MIADAVGRSRNARWRDLFGRLHGQLVLVMAGAMILAFVSAAMLIRASSLDAAKETIQRQNMGLAYGIAAMLQRDLIDAAGNADLLSMRELARNVMKINPALEIYLLDAQGHVLAHALDDMASEFGSVDIGPVRRLAIPSIAPVRLPVLGDDPMRAGRQGVFSATALGNGQTPDGYLYVILDGAGQASAIGTPAPDSLRALLLALLSISVVLGGLAIWIIRTLTRPLEDLTREVRRFDERNAATSLQLPATGSLEMRALHDAIASMQSRIREQMRALKARDSSRRELIANVSHDLRTPLANIRGYVETLQLDGQQMRDGEWQQCLTIIARQTESMGRHVSALFELSKLESGAIVPDPTAFPLAELVQDVLMGQSVHGAENTPSLVFDPGPEPQSLVWADIALIERALQNLVANAYRYTPPGQQITVTLRIEGDSASRRRLVLRIANPGPGIAPEDVPFVFDRYRRARAAAPSAASSAQGGTGLGLAIVKRILELHDAEISLTCTTASETAFEFSLPEATGPA